MSSIDNLAKDIYKVIHNEDKKGPQPYEPIATVVKEDENDSNILWVKIPGSESDTPVEKTVDAKPGDSIRVRVSGGRAWVVGNASRPPTDDTTANYAVNISNEAKKDVTILNTVVAENIQATNAKFEYVEADTAKIHNLEADEIHAGITYTNELIAEDVTTENLTAASGYIQDLTADNITANDISAASGYIKDLTADHITAGDIIADHATIDDLDANYAQIDMANVNNAWIENGTIKKAEVFDENVFDLSGNKATIARLDASKINVANLRADNLIVRRINGQPVVGGYTLIDSNSPGYSSKNPQALGWYEFVNADWVLSTDTTVDTTKAYYQEGNEVSLYDQAYIDGLESDLQQQIDGAVETFTGSVVPTLTNWPYTDWYDTSVTPVHDERAKHVGDIYYVVNSAADENGYCYRFAYDNTTHAYSWVLIKDSDVTKALSDISELQTFESETTSWIDETDQGLETIRTNYTNLSGRVDDVEDTANAALPASTFETFESTTFTDLVDEVDEQSTTMTNMTTRLGLNADGTQSATDIVSKESALEQTVNGISTRVGKTEAHLIGMYATSSTAEGTAAKVATITPAIPSGTNWELSTGTTITVKFTNANTTASPTLNVNSKGAKPIKTYANGNLSEAEYKWKAGSTFTFTYNGTNWLMQDSTASVRMSSAETSITQNADAIKLEAVTREKAINMLLDSDVPSINKVNALYNRYWSDTGQASWCTPSIVELSDPPDQGIKYACRFVATALDHTADNIGRAIAFYSSNDTSQALPLKVGTKYTVSYWARCTSGQGRAWAWYSYNKNSAGTDNLGRAAVPITDLTSTWKFFTGTVELEGDPLYNRIWFYAYFPANTAGTVEICGMNLVPGDNVAAYSTKIEQTSNNVLIQATRTDTTAAQGGQHLIQSLINVAPSGVTIDADKVNITGTTVFSDGTSIQSRIDAVEIGGRNLLIDTDAPSVTKVHASTDRYISNASGAGYTATFEEMSDLPTNNKYALRISQTSNFNLDHFLTFYSGQGVPLIRGDEYTMSVWCKRVSGSNLKLSLQIGATSYISSGDLSVPADNDWHRYTWTFTAPSGDNYYYANTSSARAYVGAIRNVTSAYEVLFCGWKLEKGNKATDWTPAPEDVQGEIDAKKSVHTLSTTYSYTYANILTYSAEGHQDHWTVSSTSGVKVGDTVRLKLTVSDMSNAPVYVVGTVDAVESATRLTVTSHGLDTTIIDGGNILTNSIGANQIKANAITANKIAIGDYNNYVTVTENDESSILPNSGIEIKNGYLYKANASASNAWVSPVLNNWTKAGEKYRVTGIFKTEVAGKVFVYIYGRNADGSAVSGASTPMVTTTANVEKAMSETITVTEALANCPKVNINVYFRNSSDASIVGYVKRLRVERMSGGELIVDGAVTVGSMSQDAQDKVLNSNVHVGGRNLFRNTALLGITSLPANSVDTTFAKDYVRGYNAPSAWSITKFDDSINQIEITLNSTSNLGICFARLATEIDLDPTSDYTMSCWAKCTLSGAKLSMGLSYYKTSNEWVWRGGTNLQNFNSTSAWQKFTLTFKPDSDTKGLNYCFTCNNGTSGGTGKLYIRQCKLEKGNKPTEWSPAPEDVQESINALDNNILVDADAPTTTRVNGVADRYWSDAGNTQITCSNFVLTDAPEQGLLYGRRFVCSGAQTSAISRGYAFYNTNDNVIPLVPNKTYTATWWARCTSGSGQTWLIWSKGDGATAYSSSPKYDLSRYWKKFTVSFTFGSAINTNNNRIWFDTNFPANTAGTVEICGCKLVAGGEAEAYITRIDDAGIKIHPANGASNRLEVDGSGVRVYKGDSLRAQYSDSVVLQSSNGTYPRTVVSSTEAYLQYSSNSWATVNSSGMQIRKNGNDKAHFYDTITLYGGNGTYPLTEISSSAVKVAQSANNYANVNSSGLQVYKDGSAVATFGSDSVIGNASGRRVQTYSGGIQVYNENNELRSQFGSNWMMLGKSDGTRVTMGTSTDPYIYMNADGAARFRADSTGVKVGDYDNSTAANRNYSYIKSDGLHVYQANTEVASFGASARVGKTSSNNIEISSTEFEVVDADGSTQFSITPATSSTSRTEYHSIGTFSSGATKKYSISKSTTAFRITVYPSSGSATTGSVSIPASTAGTTTSATVGVATVTLKRVTAGGKIEVTVKANSAIRGGSYAVTSPRRVATITAGGYDLCYTAGDSISGYIWKGASYVTNSKQTIDLTLPINKPILAESVTVSNVQMVTRQGNAYTHGSSASSSVAWTVESNSIEAAGILVSVSRTTTTNATNNSPIGIYLNCDIKFS